MKLWEQTDNLTTVGNGAQSDARGNDFKERALRVHFEDVDDNGAPIDAEAEILEQVDNLARAQRCAVSQNNDDCEVELHWKGVPEVTTDGRFTVAKWGLNAYPSA